jgi:hypothetical protein
MNKKYQVFVSSTFRDLSEERQDAIRTILDLGHIPAGMELFPASDTEQLSYIKKVIDECDYYVLITGGRYGSLDEAGVSFTEREYDYAVETGKIVLAFVHGDPDIIPVGKSDTSGRLLEHLAAFKAKVMTGRLVRLWTTREQLESLVTKSLVRAIADYPAIGWVRGDTAASEELLGQINELRIDNERLTKENHSLRLAAEPALANLADFEETIPLRFKRSYYFNRETRYANKTETFSWKELFVAIGIRLSSPKAVETISTSISEHLKENRQDSYSWSMLESDRAIVKVQLEAYGLIESYVAKTLNTGALHEFLQITDKGRSKLTEILSIKAE